MDWNNGNLRVPPPFVSSRPENSFSFVYNYNYDHFQGAEMKQQLMMGQVSAGMNGPLIPMMEKKMTNNNMMMMMEKNKKRLTIEQLDSLENSFQEDTKLEPDRKMKLAQELGLQPRQVAVWFQNRRARWKAKQLERLYDTLKHQYHVVSEEKLKLQQEVLALRAILEEKVTKNQVVSGEETVESTSAATIRTSNRLPVLPPPPPPLPSQGMSNNGQNIEEDQSNYVFTVDEYSPVLPPTYWGALPSNYPMN